MSSVLDVVTLDIFDFDKSKKKAKALENQMKSQIKAQEEEAKKKKKTQKQQTMGFYEGLRSSNISMLAPKEKQRIG